MFSSPPVAGKSAQAVSGNRVATRRRHDELTKMNQKNKRRRIKKWLQNNS
jgi:hypothetical protein